MALFSISFRIHHDTTYDRRYDSVVETIKANVDKYWDETTSFFFASAETTSKELAESIFVQSDIDSAKDLVVVINHSLKGAAYAGILGDKRLAEMLPHLKKVG